MDRLERYRQLIEKIVREHTRIPYAYQPDIELIPVIDREGDHYLFVVAGWDGIRRDHGCIIHVDIRNGKFWIHRDGTEYSVAQELLDAGVPKEHIVLAFKSPELRQYTEFAVS